MLSRPICKESTKVFTSSGFMMFYLLWCQKITVIFTLCFTGLATKFTPLTVLFLNCYAVKKLTANPIAKRWRAAWGLTVFFCVSCGVGRLSLFLMNKCLIIKNHQTFCIAVIFCAIHVAHTGRRKCLSRKATEPKAEQTYFDRKVDWKHTWVNRTFSTSKMLKGTHLYCISITAVRKGLQRW